MSKIDWTKPLQQLGGSLDIIAGLEYIGRIADSCANQQQHVVGVHNCSGHELLLLLLLYDDDGSCLTHGWLAYKLENVSEEPKNCLLVGRALDGSWFLVGPDTSVYQRPTTRAALAGLRGIAPADIIVEVPL